MEVYPRLPRELQNISLEYMSLPELVETGVVLSPQYLTSVIQSVFCDSQYDDTYISSEKMPDIYGEGFTAALLSRKLDLYKLENELIAKFIDYICEQSRVFRTLVYPYVINLIDVNDELIERRIWWNLGYNESHNPPDICGLELLYALSPTNTMVFIFPCTLLIHNPRFFLDHLHELIPYYTPSTRQLLERLMLCDRSIFIPYDDCKDEDIDAMFHSFGEDVFNLYTIAVQDARVETLWKRDNSYVY